MSDNTDHTFTVLQLLAFACAAQRLNGDYVKNSEMIIDRSNNDSDFTNAIYKHSNKHLIMTAMGLITIKDTDEHRPPLLRVTEEDETMASDIQKYYRRLSFNVIKGEDQFYTEINQLLNSEHVPFNKLGFIACLPSTYSRDYNKNRFKKLVDNLDQVYLADVGTTLEDLDSEIIEVNRSKNYDAYNIHAIIDNKLVFWVSKNALELGPCVIVKAKVKGHMHHWKHNIEVTQMNFVKAAQ
jgi:hypothetical protein